MAENIDLATAFRRAYQRIMEMAQHDPEVAGAIPDQAVAMSLQEPGLSYAEIVARALAGYGDRQAFGSRAYEIRRDASGRNRRNFLPAFTTITYGEVARRIEAIASAWRHHPAHRVLPGEFVCFIGFTSAEMATADLACASAQVIHVPIQANLPAPDIMQIFADTQPAVLVATIENLELAAGYAEQLPSLRSFVVIDADIRDDDERERIEAVRARLVARGRIALATFGELIDYGAQRPWTPLPPPAEGDDAVTMLMYTSGSTGTPKGAIIHAAMCSKIWTGAPALPLIQLAYAPLNHFMGRCTVFNTLAQGGRVYFTLKSDMSTLFDDLRLVRPTFIVFMPRVAEIIYQNYQSEVQRRIAAGETSAADAAVRAEMGKNYLGDRVVAGGVGSAPTAPEVQQFLRECFDLAFSEGYSSTEASSMALLSGGHVQRDVVIDYKLIDVPELGYYTTDKPYPRGELLLKTRHAIKGYFKRPEATAKIFDEEGWLRTGDIMMEPGADQLVWLDRRNNVIKLSQAEFVAIGPLEATILGHTRLIRQIYIYGSSYRSFLLAVVVPDTGTAHLRLGHEASREELRALALADIQDAARVAGLKSFEVPRDVLIEIEPFTHENGLLSSVRKPLRQKLQERYQDALEAMYQAMDRQQQEELAQLRRGADGLSTLERVAGALQATLGLADVDPKSRQSYTDLGGDSLGAVSLSLLLEEMFNVSVPVSVILSPTASLESLARYIDHQSAGGGKTFVADLDSVHGVNATKLRASDLTLDAFLDSETLLAAERAEPPAPETRTVLITGATGFLGRFVCLKWLEQLAAKGGKVVCLIRGRDAASARRRLDEAFGTADAALAEHYHTLASSHLEVVAGDLATPRLGLDEKTFARLAEKADQIVHPGALVNHLLSYRSLFEPNVVGTAELIRLALTRRTKRFEYVSTFGVPQMHAGLRRATEATDVRSGAPEMPLIEGYAQGYGASKWASEVLLREANEHFGLPVRVYRPDMILAHSRYLGQINVPDMFTRLLFSLIVAGIAPGSFYERAAGAKRPRAHYDGLPVEFLAAAMQQLGATPFTGFRTFNTTSTHLDDGISLDTIADWVASAGYSITRIESYADWVRRFEGKLRNLSEEQRQLSSLALMSFFSHPHSPRPAQIRNDDFVAAVRTLAAGPEVPGLSEAYIHKYLGDLQLLGLLPRRKQAS